MKLHANQIAEITEHLFLSGIGSITTENITRRGITHTLNVAVELKDLKYPAGIQSHHILMRDSEDQDLLAFLDRCVDQVESVHQSGGRILVHCVAGVSRSASVCIAYLIKYKQMSLRKAFYHVFQRRPCISPNFGFMRQLIVYEERLRGSNSVEMLPFIIGMVPDLMLQDAENIIKLAWMNDLVKNWMTHFFILVVQIIILYFSD